VTPARGRAVLSLTALAPDRVPLALAHQHRTLEVGTRVEIRVAPSWSDQRLIDVATGAGFLVDRLGRGSRHDELVARATRHRTLADTVGPGMAVLVSGLNPSLYSADLGVAFARPGNRFWPAALAAGLATRDRDPDHALAQHAMGMTDLVKRATPRADALQAAEYRAGLERLERLASWLCPVTICFVGLAGWRAAVDKSAVAGVQDIALGPSRVYVMPSTSGVNASSSLADLTEHLRRAASLT
jgi:double-stranded uracil-DNA glycosylase